MALCSNTTPEVIPQASHAEFTSDGSTGDVGNWFAHSYSFRRGREEVRKEVQDPHRLSVVWLPTQVVEPLEGPENPGGLLNFPGIVERQLRLHVRSLFARTVVGSWHLMSGLRGWLMEASSFPTACERPVMADEARETGLIGGVEKREIKIVDYDKDWPKKFETHAKIIARALGGAMLRIEHIGSTSVPELAAKPVIDILVVVADSADEFAYLARLEAAGYVLRVREPDWNEHRMFRTPERDVHVHIYSAGCREIERYLTFRDRLRRSVADRCRYEQTKRELATNEWPDTNAYAKAKTEVIESIIAAAQAVGEISR